MEIIVLIYIARRFYLEASTRGRRPLWAALGALLYLGPLVLAKIILSNVIPPVHDALFALVAFDVLASNAAGLFVAHSVGRSLFSRAPLEVVSLSNVLNWAWFAGGLLLLVNALTVGEATTPFYFGLIGTTVIPVLNYIAERRLQELKATHRPLLHALAAMNIAVLFAVIYFIATLEYSRPIAFPIVAAYYGAWLGISAACNALSFAVRAWGLRSSKSVEGSRADASQETP